MEMVGAKVPSAWKKLVKQLAMEKNLTESEILRVVIGIGLKHMKEVNGKLHALAEEGEIILEGKRAKELRRTISHFAGHQSGWRATAERQENPTVQDAYLEITENVRKKVLGFLEKRKKTKGKRTFLEWLWGTECQGCMYHINRDKEFCTKNCQMYKKIIEPFKKAEVRKRAKKKT